MTFRILAISFIVVALHSQIACAQTVTASPGVTPPGAPGDSAEIEALNSLKNESVDKLRGLDRLQAMKQSPKFISDAKLSCEMTDARDAGSGSTYLNGKDFNITSYEVACSNGVGYILVSKNHAPATAVSCFSFSNNGTAATAKNRHQLRRSDPVYCRLPANKDVNSMAAKLLSSLNASCKVTGVNSFGVNSTNNTEYVEVACENGNGYVLVLPQSNDPATPMSVMTCQDAARHSLHCKLTSVNAAAGPGPVTMQTLYDALKKNGVECSSSQLQMRMIGRESIKKRYVVETQCADRPVGLVSYIPINDESNNFETIDCSEAAKRKITCQLTAH